LPFVIEMLLSLDIRDGDEFKDNTLQL
jgi:hypothetical protein